jgi:hypothetical protein
MAALLSAWSGKFNIKSSRKSKLICPAGVPLSDFDWHNASPFASSVEPFIRTKRAKYLQTVQFVTTAQLFTVVLDKISRESM